MLSCTGFPLETALPGFIFLPRKETRGFLGLSSVDADRVYVYRSDVLIAGGCKQRSIRPAMLKLGLFLTMRNDMEDRLTKVPQNAGLSMHDCLIGVKNKHCKDAMHRAHFLGDTLKRWCGD